MGLTMLRRSLPVGLRWTARLWLVMVIALGGVGGTAVAQAATHLVFPYITSADTVYITNRNGSIAENVDFEVYSSHGGEPVSIFTRDIGGYGTLFIDLSDIEGLNPGEHYSLGVGTSSMDVDGAVYARSGLVAGDNLAVYQGLSADETGASYGPFDGGTDALVIFNPGVEDISVELSFVNLLDGSLAGQKSDLPPIPSNGFARIDAGLAGISTAFAGWVEVALKGDGSFIGLLIREGEGVFEIKDAPLQATDSDPGFFPRLVKSAGIDEGAAPRTSRLYLEFKSGSESVSGSVEYYGSSGKVDDEVFTVTINPVTHYGMLELPGVSLMDGASYGVKISQGAGESTVFTGLFNDVTHFNGAVHYPVGSYTTSVTQDGFLPGVTNTIDRHTEITIQNTCATSKSFTLTFYQANGGFVPPYITQQICAHCVYQIDTAHYPSLGTSFNGTVRLGGEDLETTSVITVDVLDYIPHPQPSISGLSPASIQEDSPGFTLSVNGSDFVSNSFVEWDGIELPTQYKSDQLLEATVPASELVNPRDIRITVVNPAPGGGTSLPKTFTITSKTYGYLPLVRNGLGYSEEDYYYLQNDMPQIHADQAWDKGFVGVGVIVAVVDSGVDLDHPDLAGQLLPGMDFVDGDTIPEDQNGHGTHVMGTVAAAMNEIGILGVAPGARILPVRVLDANGSSSTVGPVANGIIWAANQGAKIINLSLGSLNPSQTMQDAISYAIHHKGSLVIAAAGNNGDNPKCLNCAEYPAAYTDEELILAVGSVDYRNYHSSFSNTGNYLDISAPGEYSYPYGILSTYLGGSWTNLLRGTSMAAPHVSGVAALIWGAHPGYTALQVKAALLDTAVDLGVAGRDDIYGAGLVNAGAAVSYSATALDGDNAAPHVLVPGESLTSQENREAPVAPGQVLVKFKNQISSASLSLLSQFNPEMMGVASQIDEIGVMVLRVTPGKEWEVIDWLRGLPGVDYAEPDTVVTAQ